MKALGLAFAGVLLSVAVAAHGSDLMAGEAALRRGEYAAALSELRPLAIHGMAAAQTDIGAMYQQGLGVTKNIAQAREWYLKAATQGFSAAQGRLGNSYMVGEGGAPDYAKAFEWLGKAALQGFRGAAPVDQDRLAEVIVRLAEFAADQKDLVAELDVNPLICAGERILAVDALIVKKG